LGPQLVELLRSRAPQASPRFLPLEQLIEGDGLTRNIDIHLGMPPRVPSGCHSAALFEDSFVCMLGVDRAPRKLTLRAYLRAQHIRVSVLNSTRDPVDRALAERQLSRQIERTGYVATLSRRLAQTQALRFNVALCEPPLALGARATRMIWHERTHLDPGARFFRELVQEAAETAQSNDRAIQASQ
jgi:DNA-binding transcriptional LysR family regulator